MAARTPEGRLKEECRKIAKRAKLWFANVEGKSYGGWPDSEVPIYPMGSGTIHIEFKSPRIKLDQAKFERDYPQQWKRIREIRAAGGRADWCNSVARFCELIGYEPDL